MVGSIGAKSLLIQKYFYLIFKMPLRYYSITIRENTENQHSTSLLNIDLSLIL